MELLINGTMDIPLLKKNLNIHYKTQTGTSCEKCNSKAPPGSPTGPGLGLIMYILKTLEFPKHLTMTYTSTVHDYKALVAQLSKQRSPTIEGSSFVSKI